MAETANVVCAGVGSVSQIVKSFVKHHHMNPRVCCAGLQGLSEYVCISIPSLHPRNVIQRALCGASTKTGNKIPISNFFSSTQTVATFFWTTLVANQKKRRQHSRKASTWRFWNGFHMLQSTSGAKDMPQTLGQRANPRVHHLGVAAGYGGNGQLTLTLSVGHSLGPLQMAAAKKRPHF